MASFGIPLSGLIASQAQLQSVSNNLANIDTVGYKDTTLQFSDVYAQSSILNGADNPVQTGLGVSTAETSRDFSNGVTSETDVASNMALSGNGFFVLQSTGGTQSYTRAGDFTSNSSGELVTADGQYVMGYPAVDGVVDTSAPLQTLQVGLGSITPATATTSMNITANLNSSAAADTTSSFSTDLAVYDSLGTSHELNVNYTKTGTNSWSYSVTIPTADLSPTTPATTSTTTTVANGTFTFDSSGTLTSPTGDIPISIPSLADGAASLNVKWNLDGSTGTPTITQTATASTTSAKTQNGQQSGTLLSYSVASDGTIEGAYSNSQTVAIGQVAIANFSNTQGLLAVGNNNYQATTGSGAALVGTANTGGRGTIKGGYVESSNVDTAAEFAKMIVAQQAYQANAKTVTTLDNISQSTIQMITG
ncbi:MAG: flagellar hook protein FlgE [Janthinobacterium lividum]